MSLNGQRDTIVLVLGADDNYARPMAAAIHSALVNLDSGWAVDLFILDGGISSESKRRMAQVVAKSDVDVTLSWISFAEEEIRDLPVIGSTVNVTTYMRLYIGALLPPSYTKAIYLDSDIIIEDSLSKLWTKPLDSATALAVRDYWVPTVSHAQGVTCYEELGLDAGMPYFNAGVMVINLPQWRKAKVCNEVLCYVDLYEDQLQFNEQEGLNVVLAGQWQPLNPRWNVPHYVNSDQWVHRLHNLPESPVKDRALSRVPDLRRDPGIRHFVTGTKPWKRDSHYPSQHRWYAYLWDSGWLTKKERLKSQVSFYMNYYPRAIQKAILDGTRPTRHWLAHRAPKPVSHMLRKQWSPQ